VRPYSAQRASVCRGYKEKVGAMGKQRRQKRKRAVSCCHSGPRGVAQRFSYDNQTRPSIPCLLTLLFALYKLCRKPRGIEHIPLFSHANQETQGSSSEKCVSLLPARRPTEIEPAHSLTFYFYSSLIRRQTRRALRPATRVHARMLGGDERHQVTRSLP
jgi:hypothetical protein